MQRYIFYSSVSWGAVAGMERHCRRNGVALSPEWSGTVAGMEWRCRLQGGHSLWRCSTGDIHSVVADAIFPVLNVAHIVILWHFPGRCSTTNQPCAALCGIFAVLHLSMERPCHQSVWCPTPAWWRPRIIRLFRTCQTDLQNVPLCTALQPSARPCKPYPLQNCAGPMAVPCCQRSCRTFLLIPLPRSS